MSSAAVKDFSFCDRPCRVLFAKFTVGEPFFLDGCGELKLPSASCVCLNTWGKTRRVATPAAKQILM